MKINNLTLINFRKFNHQSFVFNEHFTALIGDNASGKTQVLEAIATLFSQYQFKMMRIKLTHAKAGDMDVHAELKLSDVHHVTQIFDNPNGTHQVRMEYMFPSVISATINDSEYVFCRRDDREDDGNVRGTVLERIAQDNLAKIQKQDDVVLPVLAYYGTRRLWNKRNTAQEGIPSRTDGYRWSLDSYVDFNELKDWFKKQELIQLQKGTNGAVLAVMRQALSSMIPGCESVFYDMELEELVLRFGNDKEPVLLFGDLSDGYRMILTMVFDVVKQMVMLNPQLGEEALRKTDGIILIDELDLSLHPRWQRIVVDALKQTFPKIQFIVTTHSPFIIQSLSEREVIDLARCQGMVIQEHWTAIKQNACQQDVPEDKLVDSQTLGCIWPSAQRSDQIGKSIEDITEDVMGVYMPQRSARLEKMYNVAKQYYTKLKELKAASSDEVKRLDDELTELSAPFSDDVAYHAFLEMERLAAKQECREEHK